MSKVRMTAGLLVLAICTPAFAAQAGNIKWKADSDGQWSGTFTDPAHWEGGVVPGENAGMVAYFENSSIPSDVEITFPSGEFENPSSLYLSAFTGQSFTFDGSATHMTCPEKESGYYSGNPFAVYGYTTSSAWMQPFGITTSKTAGPVAEFRNFKFQVTNTSNLFLLDFEKGDFDFVTPCGETAKVDQMVFFARRPASSPRPQMIRFGKGVNFAIESDSIRLGNGAPSNILEVAGANVSLDGIFNWPSSINNYAFPGIESVSLLHITDGGVFVNKRNLSFGNGGSWSTKGEEFRVLVDGGGVLSNAVNYGVQMTGEGIHDFTVIEGAKVDLNKLELATAAANAEGTMRIADGADVRFRNGMVLGSSGCGVQASVSDAQLVIGGSLALNNGSLRLEGGGVLRTSAKLTVGDQGEGLVGDGGKIEIAAKFTSPVIEATQVTVGAGGLEISSDQEVVLANGFVPENGTTGALAFTGTGVKTFSGESSVATVSIASGKFLLAGADMAGSSVSVADGGILSLVGSETVGSAFADLSLGDDESVGVLELDLNDTVAVSGVIELNKAEFRFSSALAAGADYTVMTSAGEVSAETRKNWEILANISQGLLDDVYYTFVCRDLGQGVTAFVIVASAEPPVYSGSTAWKGPGSDWASPANWANGQLPGESYGASFSGDEPDEITLTGNKTASLTLDSDSRSYVLAGGYLQFSATVGLGVSVPHGTHEIKSEVYQPSMRVPYDVGEGATLKVSGSVVAGGIEKMGAGRLELSAFGNVLPLGFSVCGGLLFFGDAADLGSINASAVSTLSEGTLALGAGESDDPVVSSSVLKIDTTDGAALAVAIKTDKETVLPLPEVTKGALMKRGAGRLVFDMTASSKTVPFSLNVNENNKGPTDGVYDVAEFPPDGSVPRVASGVLTSTEGELVLRSRLTDPAVLKIGNSPNFGYPSKADDPENFVQPGFVLDNIHLNMSVYYGMFATGLTGGDVATKEPYIIVSNKATMAFSTFDCCRGCTDADAKPKVFVNDATLNASTWRINNSSNNKTVPEYHFSNGAKCYVSTVETKGPSKAVFNGSVLAKNDSDEAVQIKMAYAGVAMTNEYVFQAGSYLVGGAVENGTAGNLKYDLVRFAFDNSEWIAGNADGDYDFTQTAVPFEVEVTGKGLILAPSVGRTYRLANHVAGTGGFVKRGKGRVSFDSCDGAASMDWSGVAEIEDGTLTFADGACREGMRFHLQTAGVLDLGAGTCSKIEIGGSGTVVNGTVALSRIALPVDETGVPEETLTFDFANGFASAGRLVFDLGRTEDNPVPQEINGVTVGRWTGDVAPDLSKWRVENSGRKGFRATFTPLPDHTIAMSGAVTGIMLIVR